jgi:hypothetical protein
VNLFSNIPNASTLIISSQYVSLTNDTNHIVNFKRLKGTHFVEVNKIFYKEAFTMYKPVLSCHELRTLRITPEIGRTKISHKHNYEGNIFG